MRAFTQTGRRLVIVGDGPARASLEQIAGPSIEFRGVVGDDELVALYGKCRAIVVPGREDFGLTPLEANASGRPAIAYGEGGARETVVDGETGVLFRDPDVGSLVAAIERMDGMSFEPGALRTHAESFGEAAFASGLRSFVDHALSSCIACAKESRARGIARRRAPDVPAQRTAGER